MDTVLNRQQRRTIEAALKMAHTHVLLDKNARSVERTQTLEQITEALALLDQAPQRTGINRTPPAPAGGIT